MKHLNTLFASLWVIDACERDAVPLKNLTTFFLLSHKVISVRRDSRKEGACLEWRDVPSTASDLALK